MFTIFVTAVASRFYFSPLSVIHGNSHGYEYLGSAFSGEGYFYHGSGYYAFYHWLSLALGQDPQLVFTSNILLNSLSAILITIIYIQYMSHKPAAYFAGLSYALFPAAIRVSGSESMFPLAIFLGLIAIASWTEALKTNSKWYFATAASSLAIALQTRPSMLLLFVVIALVSAKRDRFTTPNQTRTRIAVALVALIILTLPWLAFRIIVFSHELLPSHMDLSPSALTSINFESVLLLNHNWTPSWLWILTLIGVPFLVVQQRTLLTMCAVGLIFSLWLTTASGVGLPAAQLRLQSPQHVFAILLAGAGYQCVTRHLPSRFAGWVLAGSIALVGYTSSSRIPLAAQRYDAQTEYLFLEESTRSIPPNCPVVVSDRFMADGVIISEFPWWWLSGQQLIEANELPLESVFSQFDCLTYYRGITCYRFTWQELGSGPVPPIRSECLNLESRFNVTPMRTLSFDSDPTYEFFITPKEGIEIGFYALGQAPAEQPPKHTDAGKLNPSPIDTAPIHNNDAGNSASRKTDAPTQ